MSIHLDLDTFLRQPRLSGLVLSPDGRRLAVGVATLAPDGKRYRTALWQVDPDGEQPPRQLTRSAPGESNARFTADGTLLFTSARADPDAEAGDDEPPVALWALPADGGEARLVVAPPRGVTSVEVARSSGGVVVSSSIHPDAGSLAEDRAKHEARKEAGVTAQLFEDYPIRHWDAFLGPGEPARWHLSTTHLADDGSPRIGAPPGTEPHPAEAITTDGERTTTGGEVLAEDDAEPTAPEPPLLARGTALTNVEGDLSPGGTTYVTGWRRLGGSGAPRSPGDLVGDLVAIDVASGERRTLVADGRWWHTPAISPDGTQVACVAQDVGDPDHAGRSRLALVDLDDGTVQDLAPDLDLWPSDPCWLPDGSALVFLADEQGHRPVFRLDLGDGEVTRLTTAGAYSDVQVTRDGERLFALHARIDAPPRPVALEPAGADQQPQVLPSPVGEDPAGAHVERLVATADDGVEIGSWLVVPEHGDGPAPLVVLIHGGPLGTWNTWHWRWNPFVLAEHGYAVLLPDPALSLGYGQDLIQRGWGRWGEEPYTDLLAAVDAAVAHDAIDAERTAAMGGSFGGYMANWVAGHTDRFRCIITHASLWNLEAFHGTTDLGLAWEREFGDPYLDASRYHDNSPHRFVGEVTTPMLVIHGERDYRVPVSEALMLWTDLSRHGADARFLYFPDENHWILKPHNARLWYETVLAFLDEHLLGEDFQRPALL